VGGAVLSGPGLRSWPGLWVCAVPSGPGLSGWPGLWVQAAPPGPAALRAAGYPGRSRLPGPARGAYRDHRRVLDPSPGGIEPGRGRRVDSEWLPCHMRLPCRLWRSSGRLARVRHRMIMVFRM